MLHGVKAPSTHDTKSGTSGGASNRMVWHIPKAHLGNCDPAWHCSKFKLIPLFDILSSICRKRHQGHNHPKYQLVPNWKQRWRCKALGCKKFPAGLSLAKVA
jgi:hypothetical protein